MSDAAFADSTYGAVVARAYGRGFRQINKNHIAQQLLSVFSNVTV